MAEETAGGPGGGGLRMDLVFALVPTDLIVDRTLHPVDKLVAAVLISRAGSAYQVWPCNRTIAREVGCSPRTVQLALARLESVGWIAREACPTARRGNLIRFLWRRVDARPGAHPGAPPRATGAVGGAHAGAPGSRSRGSDPKPEAALPGRAKRDPAEDLLTAEEVERWEGFEAGGDRTIRALAKSVLGKHAEAKKRRAGRGEQLGECTPAGPEVGAVPDAKKDTAGAVRPSRGENPIEHNAQ